MSTILSTENKPIPVIYDDEPIEEHTDEDLFCSDPHCPCKEDQAAIGQLAQDIDEGLLTPEEADLIYRGKTI
jgi:hypothetical protein